MANGPMDPNVGLDYYRGLDKGAQDVESQVIPEKQALNTRYVSDFLSKRGITPENFDKNFTLATAIDLTASQKSSNGAQEMFKVLSKTKAFLDKNNMSNLLEKNDESTVKSDIHFELANRDDLKNEADLQRGYYTYRAVKMYCDRMFKIREQFSDVREKEKTVVDKGVKEEFAGVMEEVKKNFSHMDGKEKLLLVVGGIIGAAMLMGSDNPRIGKIRETIWTCAKIGGVAWFGNTLVKVFTGKTALQTVSDWSKSNVATEAFWTKTFKTNSEKAEIMRNSTIFLGDKNFMYLAEEYKKARDLGRNKISIPSVGSKDMTPEQIYTALDVFFTKDPKYSVENLMRKYALVKPAPNWREVVGSELIEDQSIVMQDSLVSRTVDAVGNTADKAYNLIVPAATVAYEDVKGVGRKILKGGKEVASDVGGAAKAAWAWVKDLYRKNFGEEGTDDQILEWSKKSLKNFKQSEGGDLEKFLRENNPEKQKADGYVEAMRNGQYEQMNDVDIKYVIRDAGTTSAAMYVCAGCKVPGVIGNEQGVLDAMKKSDAGAREFLKKKYPQIGDKIDTFVEFGQGAYIVDQTSYKVFVRMPLPGTTEFNQRNSGQWTPDKMKTGKYIETFGPNNKFEYSKLEPDQQNLLRLKFFLDVSQTAEINAVVDKYNRMYQDKGLPLNVVNKRFIEDSADREEVMKAMKALGFKPKLKQNEGFLDAKESDIAALEKDAASNIVGSDDVKKNFQEIARLSMGNLVRLAILGDQYAMEQYKFDPSPDSKALRKTIDDLLKAYKEDLSKKVKQANREG